MEDKCASANTGMERDTNKHTIQQYASWILVLLFTSNWLRVTGISGSLIWSKTVKELIFNPCGEFRWSPEGPVSQVHSPHLHIGSPGIFSDLLRSVQMLKRVWGAESNRSYRTYSIPGKTAALVPEFAVEDPPSAELQPRFLCLQWRTCPWAEHYDDELDMNLFVNNKNVNRS